MATQTAPVTAATLTAMQATALQIKAYNTRLRTESVINDVFESLSGSVEYNEKGSKVPEAILMKLEKQTKGAHSAVFGLLMRLKGAPSYGSTTLIGTEETLRLRHMTCYYNLIRKAVAIEDIGVNANDLSAYDVYGHVGQLFIDYFAELRGKRIREASMLTYAAELVEATLGGSAALDHIFNSNIFIPNTLLGGMPVFDSRAETEASSATYPDNDTIEDDAGDYIADICDTIKAACGTSWSNPEYMNLTIEALLALDYHCVENLKLEPLMVDGKATLIFTIPSTQMIKLLNPASSTANLGTIWKDVSSLTKIENFIPGAYCRVRHLILVEDTRYATITLDGDGATPAWTVTPGFLQPGNEDGRNLSPFNSSSNLAFDVGCVYGKGSVWEWVVQPLKYATEAYDYEMVKGKGAYQMAGIGITRYNIDATAGDDYATEYNRGTCLVIMAKPNLVTVS